jgi:isopenicillin-N epimerase
VLAARDDWQRRLDQQPMDFFVRQYESAWLGARQRLAEFVGAAPGDLVFVENATAGMNVVAGSLTLSAGDQVLLTDHAYGAVQRIWDRACQQAGADRVTVELPRPIQAPEEVVAAIAGALTDRTRLLVISHITSATALIMPIRSICQAAAARGVPVCVDGPHAPLHVDLNLALLDCDYYTASCHKWLSAPFGSGFVYVNPRCQSGIQPATLSWGRLLPALPASWDEQFIWSGTRDPSPFLSVPAAIDFFTELGLERVRARMYKLAEYARQRLLDLLGTTPLASPAAQWYGAMAHVPLPPGEAQPLQQWLWDQHRIEVPIVTWHDQRYVRVSCHLYNTTHHIDRLVEALRNHLG